MCDGSPEFDWDELLLYIEDRSVIPIIGRELLVLPSDGRDELLEHRLARELAAKLGQTNGAVSLATSLSDVASEHLRTGGQRKKIYSGLKAIMDGTELQIPRPLEQIAAIDHFNLYLSTTFDSLLEEALNAARVDTGGKATPRAFSPTGRMPEIPAEIEHLRVPEVIQVFGRLSASPEYAVTEEDTLEFLHVWQRKSDETAILIQQLRNNHLLFLGCGFPDWLSRFFIRTIRNERFLTRESSEIVADSQVSHPPGTESGGLAVFLKDHRAETYEQGDAVEFVDELHRRWTERHPDGGKPSTESDMEVGAIFLSYASQDRAAVNQMASALTTAGLDIWFDDKERSTEGDLSPGADWDREIRDNIHRCSVFLPFISKNSEQRREGYFRKEWTWAIGRAEGIATSEKFIQPIVIDDSLEGSELVPSEFWDRQAIRFPAGVPTEEFVQALERQIREMRLRQQGLG